MSSNTNRWTHKPIIVPMFETCAPTRKCKHDECTYVAIAENTQHNVRLTSFVCKRLIFASKLLWSVTLIRNSSARFFHWRIYFHCSSHSQFTKRMLLVKYKTIYCIWSVQWPFTIPCPNKFVGWHNKLEAGWPIMIDMALSLMWSTRVRCLIMRILVNWMNGGRYSSSSRVTVLLTDIGL